MLRPHFECLLSTTLLSGGAAVRRAPGADDTERRVPLRLPATRHEPLRQLPAGAGGRAWGSCRRAPRARLAGGGAPGASAGGLRRSAGPPPATPAATSTATAATTAAATATTATILWLGLADLACPHMETSSLGLADITRHVVGCHLTQETRFRGYCSPPHRLSFNSSHADSKCDG